MTKSRGLRAPYIRWTEERIAELARRYPHEKTEHIAAALGLPVGKVYQKALRLGLKKTAAYLASPVACRLRRGGNVGAAHRFQKGCVSHNKGKKGIHVAGTEATWFKKWHLPHNWVPVGAYRVNSHGILERKTTEAKRGAQRWTAVHRLVWEAAHGPIPQGHIVRFKPGMKTVVLEEITPERLDLIDRKQHMQHNSIHNLPPALKQVCQLTGAINRKIKTHERK